ncbi:MAG: hypothetical protein R2939_21445 [Kofleriaceae bacterium]
MSFELAMPTAKVTLRSPGSGKAKARALRLAASPGAHQRLRFDLDLRYGGPEGDVTSPTVEFDLDVVTTEVDATTGAKLEATIVGAALLDAAASEPVVAEDRDELARILGATLRWTVDPAGQWSAVQVDVPAGTSVTRNLFETIRVALGPTLVLPAEPVRVGATWEVEVIDELAGYGVIATTRLAPTATGKVTSASGAVTLGAGPTEDPSPPTIGGAGSASWALAEGQAIATGVVETSTAMAFAATPLTEAAQIALTMRRAIAPAPEPAAAAPSP